LSSNTLRTAGLYLAYRDLLVELILASLGLLLAFLLLPAKVLWMLLVFPLDTSLLQLRRAARKERFVHYIVEKMNSLM